MSRHYVYFLIGGVLLIIAVITLWPASAADVPTYEAVQSDFEIYVIESGSIRATNSVTITAPRIISGGSLQVV